MIQATLEAGVTFGPGREPPPGTPPFQPKLECTLSFTAPPPGNLKLSLWLVPANSGSMAAPSAAKGSKALAHEPMQAEGRVYACRADWPQGLHPKEWQAAVEFRVEGRIKGHAKSAITARYLPAAPPRGGRDQEN